MFIHIYTCEKHRALFAAELRRRVHTWKIASRFKVGKVRVHNEMLVLQERMFTELPQT